jgi:hypothetical protein
MTDNSQRRDFLKLGMGGIAVAGAAGLQPSLPVTACCVRSSIAAI